MRLRLTRWFAILVVTTMVLAACGGGGDDTDGQSGAPDTVGAPSVEGVSVSAPVGIVLAGIDLADSAGFHDMAEDLAQATEVNPRYAGQVADVVTALGVGGWPPELQASVDEFRAGLMSLQQALEAGDLAAARTAAEAVHESQHDFSHDIYAWLGEVEPVGTSPAVVIAAVDLVDTAGFHEMAEDLAQAPEVNPRYADQVAKIVTALGVGGWPPELQASVDEFRAGLASLQQALEAGDLAAARTAAEAVHDSQHDFSRGVYGWLAAYEGGTEARLGHHQDVDMMAVHLKSVDMVNTAGLHDMAEALAGASEINPRHAGIVSNLITAIKVSEWPTRLHMSVTTFTEQLDALRVALEGGDLEGARSAAEAVHESQHGFSDEFYGWLAEA